jgi:hypothetical protein
MHVQSGRFSLRLFQTPIDSQEALSIFCEANASASSAGLLRQKFNCNTPGALYTNYYQPQWRSPSLESASSRERAAHLERMALLLVGRDDVTPPVQAQAQVPGDPVLLRALLEGEPQVAGQVVGQVCHRHVHLAQELILPHGLPAKHLHTTPQARCPHFGIWGIRVGPIGRASQGWLSSQAE